MPSYPGLSHFVRGALGYYRSPHSGLKNKARNFSRTARQAPPMPSYSQCITWRNDGESRPTSARGPGNEMCNFHQRASSASKESDRLGPRNPCRGPLTPFRSLSAWRRKSGEVLGPGFVFWSDTQGEPAEMIPRVRYLGRGKRFPAGVIGWDRSSVELALASRPHSSTTSSSFEIATTSQRRWLAQVAGVMGGCWAPGRGSTAVTTSP